MRTIICRLEPEELAGAAADLSFLVLEGESRSIFFGGRESVSGKVVVTERWEED